MRSTNETLGKFSAAILLLPIFILGGCAVQPNSARLASTEKSNVQICTQAMNASLGILPVADRRPVEERNGTKPKGRYLLVWNHRIGDYVTSDEDFFDLSETSMTKRVRMDLAQTYCFSDVKMIRNQGASKLTPSELAWIAAREKVDYVLAVELNHLYGKQHQRAYFYVVPAIVFNTFGHENEIDPATGFAELNYTLYSAETGQKAWHGRVRGEQVIIEDGAYPQAAAESFYRASQNLANQFYRFVQLHSHL